MSADVRYDPAAWQLCVTPDRHPDQCDCPDETNDSRTTDTVPGGIDHYDDREQHR